MVDKLGFGGSGMDNFLGSSADKLGLGGIGADNFLVNNSFGCFFKAVVVSLTVVTGVLSLLVSKFTLCLCIVFLSFSISLIF